MLTANVRLYGETQPVYYDNAGLKLVEEHELAGVGDADPGREPGYIYAYLDLNPIGDNPDGERQGSAIDLHGTLDDYRALIANLQSFIDDNTEEATR